MPLDGSRHLLSAKVEGADGRFLVLTHQTTVTFNIGTKNGSEFAFHTQFSIGLILGEQYHRGKGCQGRQHAIKLRINWVSCRIPLTRDENVNFYWPQIRYFPAQL